MPFVGEILDCRSLSIVGLEKNTGKTECLNYLLRRVGSARRVAVTSIGVDGERCDAVTGGRKPPIGVREGMFFATSEKHYDGRCVAAEVLDVGEENTPLGRIVTARALTDGEVMLSGPSSGSSLRRWMARALDLGAELTVVDGALSRLSSASPAITEAMILSTGAALTADPAALVRLTAYAVEKIGLPLARTMKPGDEPETGVWALDQAGRLHDTGMRSPLAPPPAALHLPEPCRGLYVAGALTDRFVQGVLAERRLAEAEVVVRDFTHVFLSRPVLHAMRQPLGVLRRSRLLAVCVNPVAPNGMRLDSQRLCREIEALTGLPAYDIVKNDYGF